MVRAQKKSGAAIQQGEHMIKRVFDAPNNPPYYVCTECNLAFSGLQEASNHARECGQAVPIQPAFKSYTTAETFNLKEKNDE